VGQIFPLFSGALGAKKLTVVYSFLCNNETFFFFFIVASPALNCVIPNPTIMVVIGRFSLDLSPFTFTTQIVRSFLRKILLIVHFLPVRLAFYAPFQHFVSLLLGLIVYFHSLVTAAWNPAFGAAETAIAFMK
jgi:hypothetical protein